MTARVAIMLGLVLAACSSGSVDNRPQAACEREADNDPAVVEVYTRSNGNYTYSGTQAHADLIVARRQAVQRCLRAKGLLPPGGVQPIQPRL